MSRRPIGHGVSLTCLTEPPVPDFQRIGSGLTLVPAAPIKSETKPAGTPRHSVRQASETRKVESQAAIFSLGKLIAVFENNFSVG